MENTFGDFLKNLRISHNKTRKELSYGVCSEKQLERIEKNVNQPSIYILHHFSAKLNIDLNNFYKDFYCYGTFDSNEYCKNILNCIKKLDFKDLENIINTIANKNEFKKGNNYAHLCYGKAVYSFHIEKDYEKTISICKLGIREETFEFNLFSLKNHIYSDIGYSMLNLICGCYRKMEQFETSINIAKQILNSIDKYYLSQSFQSYYSMSYIIKLYQTSLCQIANINYNIGNYNMALTYIEKGIIFSFEHNMSRLLSSFFELKYLTLYRLGDYKNALENYNCAMTLCKNSGRKEIAIAMEEKANKEFKEIFN
ncbi:MAG TPA: hypothetical protein DC000_05510 [Clostridiales bacterium]|nr:hypothetical protein [Clostridiales bacterium]